MSKKNKITGTVVWVDVSFELCSVVEGLQVGVKANERNVVNQ